MRPNTPIGLLFALGICAILACDDHDEFRSDVVLCEEAVATLEACCPSPAVKKLHCKYLFEPNSVEPSKSSSSGSSGSSGYSSSSSSESDCGGWGCGCNSDRLIEPDLKETVSQCIVQKDCAALTTTCAGIKDGKGVACR